MDRFKVIIIIGVLLWGIGGYYAFFSDDSDDVNVTITNTNGLESAIQIALEQGYFEGQRDALKEDIRIEFDEENNVWIWSISPWDDGKEPIFKPTIENNE